MCCIATLALTVCHPAFFFKPMVQAKPTSKAAPREKNSTSGSSGESVNV